MNGGGAVSTGKGKGTNLIVKSSIGKQRDALKQKIRHSFGEKSMRMKIVDDNGKRKNINVSIVSDDVKHLANDVLTKNVIGKDKAGKLAKYFKNSYFKKSSGLYKSRNDKIDKFYYFKTRGRKLYFNVARYTKTLKSGKKIHTYRLHAITKKIK